MKCRNQQKKKMEMNSIQHGLSHGIVYLRNNSWGLEYILILPRVGPLCIMTFNTQYQYVSSYNRYSNMTSFKRFGSKSVVKYVYIGGHALEQAQICGGVKLVNRISIPPFDNWIFDKLKYIK
jgi:hypothetical protein